MVVERCHGLHSTAWPQPCSPFSTTGCLGEAIVQCGALLVVVWSRGVWAEESNRGRRRRGFIRCRPVGDGVLLRRGRTLDATSQTTSRLTRTQQWQAGRLAESNLFGGRRRLLGRTTRKCLPEIDTGRSPTWRPPSPAPFSHNADRAAAARVLASYRRRAFHGGTCAHARQTRPGQPDRQPARG